MAMATRMATAPRSNPTEAAAWRINPKQQTATWNSIESIESNNSNNQSYEGMERHGASTAAWSTVEQRLMVAILEGL
jgi:hypothetical protein